MKINVTVHPSSSKQSIINKEGVWHVYVSAPAHDNLANNETIELLSEYLDIAKTNMRIIKGISFKNKVIEVDD